MSGGFGVLSAVTLTPDRGAYLEEQVALSRDDYYAGRGESPGRWFGRGAALLGLDGVVAEGSLEALIDGRHPVTDARLRRSIASRTIRVPSLDPETGAAITVERALEPVGGFDFVFSAPKSVSLASALASPEVRREVVAAHHAAVEATLALLEREACGVRLGAGGGERVAGSGIVAARYTHRTSRAVDPHLHTHCAIANLTQGPDGKWRTLDSRLLLSEWKLTLGYVYQSTLRDEISRRLGWAWREPVKGLAELEAWPVEVLREFSQRRLRIEQSLAEHGGSGWEAGQLATLATRERKELGAVDLDAERDVWRVRLAEHGMTLVELASATRVTPERRSAPGESELVAIAERLAGPEGLTEKANTFRRAEVLRAWAAARPEGLGATHLADLTDWYLAQPAFAIELEDGRYTTPGLLSCEHELLALVDQGRGSHTAVLPSHVVDRALARAPVQLSAEQEGVVRALTSSGHGIENLEALAGTGKTTVCGVLASAYSASGYHVIGATPTGRAARELAAVGVEADTIDAILTRLRNRPTLAPRRLVILADESGMAGTRSMVELAAWARRGGAKIIQVGDSHQLAGVPASGEFAAVTRRHGAERLTEVWRQRDPEEIAALGELRDGLPERYLAHQVRQRCVRIARDQRTATDEAAFWWRRAAQEHGPHRVALITRDNDLRAELNATIRQHRVIRGELDGPTVEASGATFQRGDRIICRQNDRRIDVDNGTRGTITGVDPQRRELDVRADDGRRFRLPDAYLEAGHVEHAYALTAHSLQGGTVEAACIVSRPDDHSTRWTYTASSRARRTTEHLVIGDNSRADRNPEVVIAQLIEAMSRDGDEQLAVEHLPHRDAPNATRVDAVLCGHPLRLDRDTPDIER